MRIYTQSFKTLFELDFIAVSNNGFSFSISYKVRLKLIVGRSHKASPENALF